VPGPIDLLYTTVRGVIGAGLTQYVTHLRDRRAARALVVERLADVEEAFTALRLALPEDGFPPTESQVARKLAALELHALSQGSRGRFLHAIPQSADITKTLTAFHSDRYLSLAG
jgi:hypothetical protein